MNASRLTGVDASVLEGIDHVELLGSLGPGGLPLIRTQAEMLPAVAAHLRDELGFIHLELLTAEERSDGTPGVNVLYAFSRRSDVSTVALTIPLGDEALAVPTLFPLWPGAGPLEREVHDLFGVTFVGHPNLTRLVLRDDFVGHPLRKSFEMNETGVPACAARAAAGSHDTSLPRHPAPHSPLDEAAHEGDPVLHSERLVLNMGPQHPSTHGVLHLYLALEGETVIAAEPTHGYLHRCIEKLCEENVYRACTPLLDRCDYVSGFHTELAFMLALEELSEIEVTPKADYLRVLFSELVRITSHHTWLAAAGLDTGALTPFLYAFIDRERIVDFFEAVTGARMMFNYFRPGGVAADLPTGAVNDFIDYLRRFDSSVDEYESLLTGNEVFRLRTRGVGHLSPQTISDFGVTGPMARASGVDIDVRRDRPYAAYRSLAPRVASADSGDTFDRYMVRVAEMRESARLALAALEGMPEGPHATAGVPRAVKPPAGAAYRLVESSRGELGVYLRSDGTTRPWRLKVRSPALSNLHAAPEILTGGRIGDVVAVLGSVDVVMGEIDR